MISRRDFLAFAGGVVVLAACGSEDDGRSSGNTIAADTDEEFTDVAPAVLSSDLYASPTPQRFAFALTAKQGFASQGDVTLALAFDGATPTDFTSTTLHQAGLPQNRGVYVVDAVFDREGIWDAIADRDGEQLPFALQVKAQADAPTVGSPAPRDASPTPANPLAVDPICTRNPVCPLHERSLDTLIGQGRPVVVLFATPARCTSQYCGPVLDSLLPLVDTYQDRVDVVHVDIFQNLQTDETSPTVTAWGLPSEPWLFGIDSTGMVTARLDGAFGQDEMRAVLEGLAAST